MMVVTSARAVGIQYYRTLMLVVLGLSVLANMVWMRSGLGGLWDVWLLPAVATAFFGSVVWTLGRVALGQAAAVLLVIETFMAMAVPWVSVEPTLGQVAWLGFAGDIASASLLGSMMAAMLLGHSYLIAPAMSIEPLKRLVKIVAVSLAGRAALAGVGLAMLAAAAANRGRADGHDAFWWGMVATRWAVGVVAPAVITWMVWQTAKIRSTQSATGILYVGVVFTLLGELCDQIVMAPFWTTQ